MCIPQVMKGLVITDFTKPYQLENDIPVPTISGPNDILIKVATAGYCISDEMIKDGLLHTRTELLPLVPSHECAGTVVAIGSAVTNVKVIPAYSNEMLVGDRVGVLGYRDLCGTCDDCRRGTADYCESMKFSGMDVHGAAAEYMLSDADSAIVLHENISFDEAATLMCTGVSIYKALKVANLQEGQTVAIIGTGAMGHLGIQFAKCMGLTVAAIDTRQAPLDLAKSLKYPPDFIIDATKGVEHAKKEMGGTGPDATIVATDADDAFNFGLALTRKHGTFVIVGLPKSGAITVPWQILVFRNITVKGSMLCDPETAVEAVNMVVTKEIQIKTRGYSLEEVECMLEDYRAEAHSGKMVLKVSA
ncbi:chaperonin 10-like protein [Hysterangium stoloniferum]|nr:chaperonin 10-like protein [Hysterangium stoloniferum]